MKTPTIVGLLILPLLLAVQIGPATAQEVDSGAQAPATQASGPPSSFKQQLAHFGSAAIDLFQQPLHPTLATVAPGGGLTGGIGYTPPPTAAGKWHQVLRASVSTKKYWALEADTWYQDGNLFRIEGYGRARRMTQLPYFGLGSQTPETALTDFSLLERTVGGLAWVRFVPAVAIGGRLEELWPSVDPGDDSSLPSIGRRFTDLTAPGLGSQPSFTRYQAFVDFNHPAGENVRPRQGGDYKLTYNFFQDHAAGQDSFQRLDAEGQERIGLGQDSKLTLHALYSISETASGARVPFYLMSTLGGADNLRGFRESLIGSDETIATLRGFRDFRFRDQDMLLLQAEFRQKIWGPVDITVFADAGKVAHQASDLDFSHLRHDFGFSISLMRVTATIVRFDFAFGGGEGTHGFLAPGRVIAP